MLLANSKIHVIKNKLSVKSLQHTGTCYHLQKDTFSNIVAINLRGTHLSVTNYFKNAKMLNLHLILIC